VSGADAGGSIRHEAAQRRFVMDLGGEEAVLDYVVVSDQVLDYAHTFVPPSRRGRGFAHALVRHALDWALENQVAVVPGCPFVAAVMRRDPRYARLEPSD
jgi:predicted GNAT family acetyltransferase